MVPVTAMKNGDFSFIGFTKSTITQHKNTNSWKMEILSDPKKYAITNGTLPPFGTREYHLSEDLGGGSITLTLNACEEGTEYNCDDGSCIPIEQRCDSHLDCSDGSDERQCLTIEIPTTYLRHVPAGARFISVCFKRNIVYYYLFNYKLH